MNDGIHELYAGSIFLNSTSGDIILKKIHFKPAKLSSTDTIPQYFVINIDSLKLKKANVTEFLDKKQLIIEKGEMSGFIGALFTNNNINKKKEKIAFDKEVFISKIDFYKLFHKFLKEIQIDTLSIIDGKLDVHNNMSIEPTTFINKFNVNITGFLVDSMSLFDTSRFFYSKDINMQINGLEHYTKDLSHIIDADYFFFSTKKENMTVKNLSINPNPKFFKNSSDNLMNIRLLSVNFIGFDLKKYFHFNNIQIQNIDIAKSDIDIQIFREKKGKKQDSTPVDIRKIVQDFADSLKINKINVQSGKINYLSKKTGRNDLIHSEYRAKISGIVYSAYETNIKKSFRIADANLLFTNIKYVTPDSIYTISLDSAFFSSSLSYIKLYKFNMSPTKNVFEKAKAKNKSMLFSLNVPVFQIDKTNILSAFRSDSLGLNNIKLPSISLNVYYYPEISEKEAKKNLIDSLKRRTIKELISIYSNTRVDINEKYSHDSLKLENYNLKIKNLDSTLKFTVHNILKIKVKQKQISAHDSSIAIINTIKDLFYNYTDSLKNIVNKEDIELSTLLFRQQLVFLKESFESPKVHFQEILKNIRKYFSKIDADTLLIQDANLNYFVKTKSEEKKVFSSLLDFKIYNFKFDTVSNKSKLFFSDRVRISLRNPIYVNKNFRINTDSMYFDSADSLLNIFDLNFDKLNHGKVNLRVNCSNIKLNKFDLNTLFYNRQFIANELLLSNSKISLYEAESDTNKNKKLNPAFFLPDYLKILILKKITLYNTVIEIWDKTNTRILYGVTNFETTNFMIDSVTYFNKNPYFLPIENFHLEAKNINYRSPDSNTIINAGKAILDSKTGKINLENFVFDKYKKISDTTRNKINSMSVSDFLLSKLDFKKLISDKEAVFDSLKITEPYIYTKKEQKEPKPNSNDLNFEEIISKIDLYKIIKQKINKIEANYVILKNITYDNISIIDSVEKKTFYDNIDLKLFDFFIDSTTTVKSPNLFYAKNVIVDVYNKKFKLDNIYSLSFNKLSLSTQSKYISITNLDLSPNMPLKDVQKLKKYRTTAVALKTGYLTIMNIDWQKLFFENYIKIQLLQFDSTALVAYVDRKAKHNYSVNAKHLIAPIYKVPLPLSIDLVKFRNSNISYYETNPTNNDTAYITINKASIDVTNITNDSMIINNISPYTQIQLNGMINKLAPVKLTVTYLLTDSGNTSKVVGSIGNCPANTFNTYLYNGANLSLDSGYLNSVNFYFTCYDSLAVGKMDMRYKNLKTSLISSDSIKRRKLKFVSWLANFIVVKNNNPGLNPVPKIGGIAYIHDRTYGDIRMWLKAIVSGVKSTVAFKPRDARRIYKIRRKNHKLDKLFEE